MVKKKKEKTVLDKTDQVKDKDKTNLLDEDTWNNSYIAKDIRESFQEEGALKDWFELWDSDPDPEARKLYKQVTKDLAGIDVDDLPSYDPTKYSDA